MFNQSLFKFGDHATQSHSFVLSIRMALAFCSLFALFLDLLSLLGAFLSNLFTLLANLLLLVLRLRSFLFHLDIIYVGVF